MVATLERDRLNHIFAKDIKESVDVEESLRLQRLNVGFSRAKECIIIYHSKPLPEFKGGIQVALNHFKGVLEKGRLLPDQSQVDQSSPMEKKVLSWLNQISIKGELGEKMEIDAQFEVGAYLKQLDETYKHPKYKVDFLVKVKGKQNSIQIIIEYDGFKEHFENLDEVSVQNYQHYMKPADVERQKILESYGYKFIRINRFNMGQDPVKTLDERLRELIDNLDSSVRLPSLVEEHQNLQNSINNKESKVCKKCEEVKQNDEFFDWDLGDGAGGYGLICTTCKKKKNKKNKSNKRNIKKKPKSKLIPFLERTYLNCPYSQRKECKALGGKWDFGRKKWYIHSKLDEAPFKKWINNY
jgi:very-short-patch-repair endonuclease